MAKKQQKQVEGNNSSPLCQKKEPVALEISRFHPVIGEISVHVLVRWFRTGGALVDITASIEDSPCVVLYDYAGRYKDRISWTRLEVDSRRVSESLAHADVKITVAKRTRKPGFRVIVSLPGLYKIKGGEKNFDSYTCFRIPPESDVESGESGFDSNGC